MIRILQIVPLSKFFYCRFQASSITRSLQVQAHELIQMNLFLIYNVLKFLQFYFYLYIFLIVRVEKITILDCFKHLHIPVLPHYNFLESILLF